jgi:Leucine-rich repeat (LRR) protein
LEYLNLSKNQIKSIPESIKNLKNLKNLIINANKLTEINKAIGILTLLESLDIQYNNF